MAPPKNVEPPKSEVPSTIKPDVAMKPPSEIIEKKGEDLLPKETFSKYPPREDYYKKPSTTFDPKRYTSSRDDDRDYRAKRDYHH